MNEKEQAREKARQRSDCMEDRGGDKRLGVSNTGHIVPKIILINGNGRHETQTK